MRSVRNENQELPPTPLSNTDSDTRGAEANEDFEARPRRGRLRRCTAGSSEPQTADPNVVEDWEVSNNSNQIRDNHHEEGFPETLSVVAESDAEATEDEDSICSSALSLLDSEKNCDDADDDNDNDENDENRSPPLLHRASQNSFNLNVEPIPSLPREKRFHYYRKRRPPRDRTGAGEENEENGQKTFNCIKLPYTDVIRSANDFLQDIFSTLLEHDRFFFKMQQDVPGTPSRDDHMQQGSNIFNQQQNPRSVSLSTGNSSCSHIDPWTGEWMSQEKERSATSTLHQEAATQPQRTWGNRIQNVSFHRIRQKPRFITVFASPEPDSTCSVSLLKGSICSKFSVDIRVVVATCFAQLRQTFKVERSRFSNDGSSILQSACFIFLNLGSRQDVRNIVDMGTNVTGWIPRLYVIDYRRPICPEYFFVVECQSDSQSADPVELRLRQNSRTPCIIITTDDELERISAERKRTEALWRRYNKQKRRQEILALQASGESVEDSGDEDDELECLDEDDFELQEKLDEELVDDNIQKYLLSKIEGEYFGIPSCLVLFESLVSHNLETPGMFFTVATGLAYHLLSGTLSTVEYRKELTKLKDLFNETKKRCWRSFHIFESLRYEQKELLSPLLRFTSLQDGIKHSRLFVRCQTSWFRTADMVERELSAIRVQLDLHEGTWIEEFRFLAVRPEVDLHYRHEVKLRDQNRLLKKSDVLRRATMRSRRLQAAEAPDANEEETSHLIYGPAFIRYVREVGLPDRITSVDASFLLLGLLSRPSPSVFQLGGAVPGLIQKNINEPVDMQDEEITNGPSDITSAIEAPSFDFKHIHETRGYSKPLFSTTFLEALRLLEWLTHPGWLNHSQYGFVDHGEEQEITAYTTSVFENNNNRTNSIIVQQDIQSTDIKESHSRSLSLSYGNLWDSFKPFGKRSEKGGATPNQSLATLVTVCLKIQREIVNTVIRLLEKRRQGRSDGHRKAIGNVEGLIDETLPIHLHHPLIIKYIANLTSDCIAVRAVVGIRNHNAILETVIRGYTRGVPSLCPSILLMASSMKSNDPGVAIAFKPNPSYREPNKMGIMIQRSLEHLHLSGVIDSFSQDDFEASLAYVPRKKGIWLFNALFPNVARPQPTAARAKSSVPAHNLDNSGSHSESSISSDDSGSDNDDGNSNGDNGDGNLHDNHQPTQKEPQSHPSRTDSTLRDMDTNDGVPFSGDVVENPSGSNQNRELDNNETHSASTSNSPSLYPVSAVNLMSGSCGEVNTSGSQPEALSSSRVKKSSAGKTSDSQHFTSSPYTSQSKSASCSSPHNRMSICNSSSPSSKATTPDNNNVKGNRYTLITNQMNPSEKTSGKDTPPSTPTETPNQSPTPVIRYENGTSHSPSDRKLSSKECPPTTADGSLAGINSSYHPSKSSQSNHSNPIPSQPRQKPRIILRPRSASIAENKDKTSKSLLSVSSNDTDSPTLSYRSKRNNKHKHYSWSEALADAEKHRTLPPRPKVLSEGVRLGRTQNEYGWRDEDDRENDGFQTSLSKRRRMARSPKSSPRGWRSRNVPRPMDDHLSSSLPARPTTSESHTRRVAESKRSQLENNSLTDNSSGNENSDRIHCSLMNMNNPEAVDLQNGSHSANRNCPSYPVNNSEPSTPVAKDLAVRINQSRLRVITSSLTQSHSNGLSRTPRASVRRTQSLSTSAQNGHEPSTQQQQLLQQHLIRWPSFVTQADPAFIGTDEAASQPNSSEGDTTWISRNEGSRHTDERSSK